VKVEADEKRISLSTYGVIPPFDFIINFNYFLKSFGKEAGLWSRGILFSAPRQSNGTRMVSALTILDDQKIPTLENALYYADLAPVYMSLFQNLVCTLNGTRFLLTQEPIRKERSCLRSL
jgi:hypothetical protein